MRFQKVLSIGRRVTSGQTKRAPKHRRPSAPKPTSVQVRERSTVLLVDDDPSILPALARLIRAAGFSVRTFDRPSAVLASETPKTNACMLVDVHLPEMNGVELCKALAESGRSLPAIMITGRTDAETRRLIEYAHPVAALFKPIDEQALLEAVEHALAIS